MVKRGIIIFGVAFLIRVGFSVFVFMEPERSFGFGADSYCYNDLAKRMIEYHRFSVYPKEDYMPEPARTPGYPFLLSIIYKIFGRRAEAVVLSQALLDSITGVLIFIICSLLFSPLVGFISGLLYGVNLHQSLYTTQILTETTFTFFLCLSFLSLLGGVRELLLPYKHKPQIDTDVHKFSDERRYYLLLSGFLLGIAVLIRPIGIYFPIFVVVWLFRGAFPSPKTLSKPESRLPRDISIKNKLKLTCRQIGLFILVFGIVISPWGMRNYRCFGKFFISSMGNISIAHFSAAPVLAKVEGISESKARERIFEIVKDKYGVSDKELAFFGDDPRVSGLMREVGLEIIRRNLGIYVKEHLLGFLKVFAHSELAYWARLFYGYSREKLKSMKPISKEVLHLILTGKIRSGIRLAYEERLKVMPLSLAFLWGFISVFELVIYVFGFFGGRYLFRENQVIFLILILIIFYFAFMPGPVGDGRFRVPIEPYISILAGCGIIYKLKIKNQKSKF